MLTICKCRWDILRKNLTMSQVSLNLSFLLAVVCCLVTTSVCSNSSYYVVAPNGAPCPPTFSSSSSTCQEVSYYTSQPSVFFTNNTVFYFLEGHHTLDQQVVISGVNNLTLQGLGTIETGHHETVTQSTVVIKCNRSTGGFVFIDGDSITINVISFDDCAGKFEVGSNIILNVYGGVINGTVNASLTFAHVHRFQLKHVSIQNANGFGLLSINCFNVSMEGCSFSHNQRNASSNSEYRWRGIVHLIPFVGGNALVLYLDSYLTNHSLPLTSNNTSLDILCTNFTFSQGRQYGSGIGLLITFNSLNYTYKANVHIDNTVIYGNAGSGNLIIAKNSKNSHYTVTINGTLILYGTTLPVDFQTPGIVEFVAGGLSIITESNHDFNNNNNNMFLVYNSTIAHNQASIVGGIFMAWYSPHVIII